jgi:hypothetical protein
VKEYKKKQVMLAFSFRRQVKGSEYFILFNSIWNLPTVSFVKVSHFPEIHNKLRQMGRFRENTGAA